MILLDLDGSSNHLFEQHEAALKALSAWTVMVLIAIVNLVLGKFIPRFYSTTGIRYLVLRYLVL